MTIKQMFLILLVGTILIGIVGATTTTLTATEGTTSQGPLGLLISLGIENVPGLLATQVTWFYNLIGVGLLLLLGSITSERNVRHWTILVPIMGAMFVFFGWIHAPTPTQTWGIIIFAVFVAVCLYMKGSLKENFGIGGPGSTLLNILMLVILFQSIVGLVNLPSVALFNNQNVAPTPAEY